MNLVSGVLAALLLAAISWMPPAYAQGAPPGSYSRSCSNVGVQGDTLVATCRRGDGRLDRSALAGFRRCVGDIGNNNGTLECGTPSGVMRGQVMASPGPGPGSGAGPGSGYGAGPGYAAPAYGAPPPGWAQDRWARCHELHERAEDLRVRLEREFNPTERGRIQGRLQEVREQENRCH